MSDRFLKFIPSEEAFWLMQHKPNAFYLLTHIANTARRRLGHPDGLLIGQCHLQHLTFYKFTERQYRTAKQVLIDRKHIKIIETNRTRQKSTTGTTTKSTLVQLCSLTIYDINSETNDDRNDDRETTDRRLTDDKQEGLRRSRKKKNHHPQTPSLDFGLTDDEFLFESEKGKGKGEAKIEVIPGIFLTQFEVDECIKIKGSMEKVREAMLFIQNNPKRQSEIVDWPHALKKWKVKPKKTQAKENAEENEDYAKKLIEKFKTFSLGNGWRCMPFRDTEKDQIGMLFQYVSDVKKAFFLSLADGQFKEKCIKFIYENQMEN